MRDAEANFYHFTDEQIQASKTLQEQFAGRLAEIFAGYEPDIKLYRQELAKNQDLASMPGTADIPNRSARLAKRSANPTGEPGITTGSNPSDWRADVAAIEADYQRALRDTATDDQRKLGSPPTETSNFDKINVGIVWLLITAGGCLLIGLFTSPFGHRAGDLFALDYRFSAPVDRRHNPDVQPSRRVHRALSLSDHSRGPLGRPRLFHPSPPLPPKTENHHLAPGSARGSPRETTPTNTSAPP